MAANDNLWRSIMPSSSKELLRLFFFDFILLNWLEPLYLIIDDEGLVFCMYWHFSLKVDQDLTNINYPF